MPDNKDCKSTRGSFQSGYDNESAKSLSDICPESVHNVQLLKGGKKMSFGMLNVGIMSWAIRTQHVCYEFPPCFNRYKLQDESNLFCIKATPEALAFSEVIGQIR